LLRKAHRAQQQSHTMKRISRRKFLSGSMAAAAGLAACGRRSNDGPEPAEAKPEPPPPRPGRPPTEPDPPPAASAPLAVDSKLVDVHGSDPAKMVGAALTALGGIEAFVKKGDRVVVKPNAAFAKPPEWATTTNPAVVRAVVAACHEAGASQVLLVERPGGRRTNTVDKCGIAAAVADLPNTEIQVLLDRDAFRKIDVPGGKELRSVEVAEAVLSADVYINIPVAKHHGYTRVTFGMKNEMGVIWDRRAFHGDLEVHAALADLGRVVKPQLTILDGTRILLSGGPSGPGKTATPGRVIASRDFVAVDALGLTLGSFGGRELTIADVPHIRLAGEMGLGQADIAKANPQTLKT
jgi:uncharacterized protein (DUF362 family)